MQRYFFDIVRETKTDHDFHGHEFPTPDAAHDLAHLIALDIQCSSDNESAARLVKVYNAAGQLYWTVTIRPELLQAA